MKNVSLYSSLALILSVPGAALAAPFAVPVSVDWGNVQREVNSDDLEPGEVYVAEEYPCTFEPFSYQTPEQEGVSFEYAAHAEVTLLSGTQLAVEFLAYSTGTCGDSVGYDGDQSQALSGDAIVGTGAPALASTFDAATINPVGFNATVSSETASGPWSLDAFKAGVPPYDLGSATYRQCKCSVRISGIFNGDPGPLLSIAPPTQLLVARVALLQECEWGGVVVERGLDDGAPGGITGNGTLELEEIDASMPVCSGSPGAAMLVATVEQESSAECASGGLRVASGLDSGGAGATAGNGVLEEAEESSVTSVCNGHDGGPGHSSLVAVLPSEDAAACATGGLRIATGVDDGGSEAIADNGVLESAEEDTVQYLCNGAPGFSSLVSVEDVPPGQDCPAGGIAISTGLDDGAEGNAVAGDGVLDADEVDSKQLICHGESGSAGVDGHDGDDGQDGADGQDGSDGESGVEPVDVGSSENEESSATGGSSAAGCSTSQSSGGGWSMGLILLGLVAIRRSRRY